MQISVIIPVYNSAKFLEECIASVIAQQEVAEVIIVDDGSEDDSLQLCHQLAKLHAGMVKVLTHPNGENFGSATTRNVGIQAATYPYIAFIDSDDYFMPNRFETAKRVFEEHPDADGVYEATDNFFENNAQSFSKTHLLQDAPKRHMVNKVVAPKDLLALLLKGDSGVFLLQGLCVKKSIFEKSGIFNPEYRVAQDMLMIKKMAAVGRLYPGDLEKPVSMRRIHNTNITFSPFKDIHPHRFTEGKTLFEWGMKIKLGKQQRNLFLAHYYRQYMYQQEGGFTNQAARKAFLKEAVSQHPGTLLLLEYWKMLPFFGRLLA